MKSHISLPRTLGKYQILDVLGAGGMGTVYRALDPVLERIVAIKLLHREHAPLTESDDIWARFRNEARAVARLNHPAIVSVYDFSDAEPLGAFFAMEYVDGFTLDHYMSLPNGVGLAHAFELIVQLLEGLGYAHEQGIVHRDIKPANLLVTREGQLKITDFGIAKVSSLKQTQTGARIGTPLYMAPEQYCGGVVDQRCDLHAVGVLFFQLLCGQPPFTGAANEIMFQICNTIPPPVSSLNPLVPMLLDPVLAKALAKNPDARFQTAGEFAAAVGNARVSLGLTAAQMVRRPVAAAAVPTRSVAALEGRARVESGNTAPSGWSVEQLAEIEQQLAPILGPMARIIVKRAAAQTGDRKRLYEEIAAQLRSDEERKGFLSGGLGMRRTDGGAGSTPHGEIAPATRSRTTQILSRYLGPIAAVLVKKTAPVARNETDLYARLAERITDLHERERFIVEVNRSP